MGTEIRELKFRAWDSEKRLWVMKHFHIIGETTIFGLLQQYSIKNLDNLVIQQYIGLVDRNGIPVYDGDIIEISGEFLNNYWDVVWNKKSAGFEFKIRGMEYDTQFICNFKQEDISIVGNIFENINEFKNSPYEK